MTPKVIDYGHKPADEYKPIKTIDYGHASKPSKPQQQQLTNNKQQQQQSTAQQRLSYMQRKRLRKKLKQQQKLQTDIDKTQDNENKNEEEKSKQQNINNDDDYEKEEQSEQQEGEILENDSENDKEKSNDDLEEISDAEDLNENIDTYVDEGPPAPPPPPMLSSGSKFMPIYKVSSETPTSIFPSTAIANENIPKMSAKHVQMSFPSVENQNTISVDEILFKPGRLTRPKKICVILRGPPGSGKSHVAKLIKEKEKEMGSGNPRILSVDDYFLIENDYEEKCPKTGKKIPKKEILYEYDNDMEETYMQYLIKSFKKTITDNLYDFIVIDCNNNSLRTLNEFYCHSKDSGFMPYIIDLFCDLETCLSRNIHQRSMDDIKNIIDTWKPTPLHYIKLDVSTLLENVVEMEDAENVAVDENKAVENTENDSGNQLLSEGRNEDKDVEDDSNDGSVNCGFLKSKWETDNTSENLARLDGTRKLGTKRKPTMEEYLQMDDWQPRIATNGKKRVRWADIEEKREQDKMRAVGFVVGHTDWKRMMDPNAANRALNKTKYIERVKKRR
uniref:YLP motif-containing protein 1 n=1 Tax=Glossina brevipalpis TaxID=37001 RepID=A0A240SWD9_9MUSC